MKKFLFTDKVRALAWVFSIVLAGQPAAWAGDGDKKSPSDSQSQPYSPPVAPASDEAKRAIRSFRVPSGLNVELFAAEPLLANPVAFCIDEKGTVYVAETFRLNAGVTDTREHMNWLDADLACRTVADRVAMYKKFLGKGFAEYNLQHDRVKRIVDRRRRRPRPTGPRSSPTASTTRPPESGPEVLARKDDVWFTSIPWLWKLRDTNSDGQADKRTLLHEGYGVPMLGFWVTTCTAFVSGLTAGSISASAIEDST